MVIRITGIHIDYDVSPDCVNPDSYGEICVRCGRCGRKFSKEDRAVVKAGDGGDDHGTR